MNIGLIIPTLNAGSQFIELVESIKRQDIALQYKLIIDSASDDGTVAAAQCYGFDVIKIERAEFDHGATRNMGLGVSTDIDVLVFLTQDVILASPDSLRNLISVFVDSQVGAVYGRQLPHKYAGVLAAHARLFNYRGESSCRNLDDARSCGIKAVFMSNSFAAYRRKALEEVGGFPNRIILGEDVCVAAKMILKGWKTSYCAEAMVYHSHDYTLWEEFRRYFDIGAFHCSESWILGNFGCANSEGKRFVMSELNYLWNNGFKALIPYSIFRNAAKFLAYQLGRRQRYFPLALKRRLSHNRSYWPRLR
jgi:rhamnosyltransferase